MKIELKSLSLVLAASLTLIGCISNNAGKDFSMADSKLNRNLSPSASQTQLTQLARNNNDFAFDMFSKLRTTQSGNILFSPYSISEALVMTYAGAKGDTKTQMADVLHFSADDAALHSTFNALDLHLNHVEDDYIFSVANSLWAQKEYKFVDNYLDTLKVNYGTGVNLLNFSESEKSRNIINSWVEDKTRQKIKNLIPKGTLSADTKLVLTNAVYFNGQWVNEFEKANTREGTFHLLDGNTNQTAFMRQVEIFDYTDNENYQAINLPYKGERTSMFVVLPKKEKFETVLKDIKNVYRQALENLTENNINLKMPKFEFTTGVYELKNHFQELGMIDAFGGLADFSGISVASKLFIDSILHKAFIKVDEKGTEAAAATAVIMKDTGEPGNQIEMSIDRPFIFFIKDIKSGQILFLGVVKNPKV